MAKVKTERYTERFELYLSKSQREKVFVLSRARGWRRESRFVREWLQCMLERYTEQEWNEFRLRVAYHAMEQERKLSLGGSGGSLQ